MALLETKNLSKHFVVGENEIVALNDVNLKIEKSEFIAIIGPSGSGKSTLMHILGLLDTPTIGEYCLGGKAVKAERDSRLAAIRRNEIGFVFQSFNLLPRLNVIQNVMLPMVYSRMSPGARKSRALELLKEVGIEDKTYSRLNQISGGQTQRVAVARALANNPKIILADEPTGNLDTQSSEAIIKLLRDLNRKGNTIVIVTHNPDIARETDRVIELRDGQIVKDSKPRRRK